MKLKNFSRHAIRVTAPIGGHVLIVGSGETRDVPAHIEEHAIRAGLVPLDDVTSESEREAVLEAAAKAKAEAEAKAQEKAAQEKADALEAAAKASRSEAAKKAAATRAAKKANKED